MELELVDNNDSVLTNECEFFDFSNPPMDPIELAQSMVKFMYDNNGIGLAANQVGIPYRVFAMRGNPENFVCFNPKIIYTSVEKIAMEESCLNFPGMIVKIKRPKDIRCRFQTPNGDILTKQFSGMTARIFQHEMDLIDGVIFYNRANLYHKEQALKKWNRGERYEMKVNVK